MVGCLVRKSSACFWKLVLPSSQGSPSHSRTLGRSTRALPAVAPHLSVPITICHRVDQSSDMTEGSVALRVLPLCATFVLLLRTPPHTITPLTFLPAPSTANTSSLIPRLTIVAPPSLLLCPPPPLPYLPGSLSLPPRRQRVQHFDFWIEHGSSCGGCICRGCPPSLLAVCCVRIIVCACIC